MSRRITIDDARRIALDRIRRDHSEAQDPRINPIQALEDEMSTLYRDFSRFVEALIVSGSRIDAHYFQLRVARREQPVFRERVYCYELYHQLRTELGDNFDYKLDGEVDKAGHPLFRYSLRGVKPDFVVHDPGGMDRNLVVIEVKPKNTSLEELREDLRTLRRIINRARYYRGIMMIYGGGGDQELPGRLITVLQEFPDDQIVKIWHRGPGTEPTILQDTIK